MMRRVGPPLATLLLLLLSLIRLRTRTGRKYDQPLYLAPQLMNRVQMQAARQPAAAVAASRHDHLVIVATAGLGTHRLDKVLLADQATCPVAGGLQMPHRQVHPVLDGSIGMVTRLGRCRVLGRGRLAVGGGSAQEQL